MPIKFQVLTIHELLWLWNKNRVTDAHNLPIFQPTEHVLQAGLDGVYKNYKVL